MKLKYLQDRDPWMLGEDIPNCDFFFSQMWLSNFTNEFSKYTGRAYKKIICIHRGYHLWFYYGKKDSFEVGENIVKKILRDPKYAQKINREIPLWSDKLRRYVDSLPQENLEKFSNAELWKMFDGHDKVHTDYYCWGWLPVAADMFHNNLTDKLKKYLASSGIKEEKINEYLVILTQPTKKSLIQIEQEDLLGIGQKIQANKKQYKLFCDLFKKFKEEEVKLMGFETHSKEYEEAFEKRISDIKEKIDPAIYRELEKHYLKYFYTRYLFTEKQGVYSFDHYLKELIRLAASGDLKKKYQGMQKEFLHGIKEREALIKKLKISKNWRMIFDAFGDFMVTKIYRRYAQIYALYRMETVLREIGGRLGLSLMQTKFLTPIEIKKALLEKKIPEDIYMRTALCVYFTEKGQEFVFTGEKAKKLAEKTQKIEIQKVKEFSGQCGCVGKATGIVRIINEPKDMRKMNKGDILVSIATNPDLVPAMKKAAAIITEQGGVTSHAAIVAREMRIPCVIGTKIATKVLRDGYLVEADATKGVVKILKTN